MNGRERQREMMAQAERQRLARRFRNLARGTSRARRSPRPIREHYLVTQFDTDDESDLVTEVCWPVFYTAPATWPGPEAVMQ
jgi:hypothetical protein